MRRDAGPETRRAAGLTHSQEQIWVGQRLHPDSPLYNMAFRFVIQTELRPDLFRQAWRRVVDANEILRTTVAERGGRVEARILEPDACELEVLDFRTRCDPEGDFRTWCAERCARPMALDGPLVQSVLAELGDGRSGWYLCQHHLVTDAWSTRLLYRAVAAEYTAVSEAGALGGSAQHGAERGSQHGAEPLAAYDATAAALQAPAKPAPASTTAHWSARREGSRTPTSLYGTSGQPAGTASDRSTLELDAERSRALEALTGQEGFASVSAELSRFALFATLLASWLHRIAGQAEVGFDAPVAGRPTPESKRALGLFIEMFPFVVRVAPRETFRSLGAKCLDEAMRFLRHARPGLSAPSGATASGLVLNYVPGAFGPFLDSPAEVEWMHPGHGDSVHALRLQVHDFSGHGRYTLHFDANLSALPKQLQARGRAHFEALLDACLADPDRQITTVDIRTEAERQALAALSSAEDHPLPRHTVVAAFTAQARSEPEWVALRQGDAELSFGELLEQSEALASTLIARGIECGDRIAILGRRSIEMVVAILATLRARAAYVPIDSSTPSRRLSHVLEDSGARLVLAGEGFEAAEGCAEADVLSIREVIREAIRTTAGEAIEVRAPELCDAAYLIYTSGSTGVPKGVLIEHDGLADYLEWASRRYVRGARLSYPLFTSIAFDLTVTSLFLPLITGGTLEIYPEPSSAVDTAVLDVAAANRVDFIKLTPSHLALLTQVGMDGSRIQRMVVGGENFAIPLADTASAQLGGQAEIHNEYGPTEAVVGCVAHLYDPAVDVGASVPIGRPADHVAVEILDASGTPVPEGVPGELWILRPGLARGYHRRPGLTAERFQPGGKTSVQGERSRRYRTGDLVRMTGAGQLEYLGRLDRQVKVAGFRVELGEIEAALLELPGIEQCAVLPRRRTAPTPRSPAIQTSAEDAVCERCGLSSSYPRARLDTSGVCAVCRTYDAVKDHAQDYFKTPDDLRALFAESAHENTSGYDCMMLYSGGKDSTYALCQLVEMGLSVYTFTLDNGFISDGAKENIRRVAAQLGVPVEMATTPAMDAIFRDSLERFSNVCNGCFKTIYTLSTQRARELGIPIIVTGLSRGQMFETRLTEEMFRDGRRGCAEIDAAVLAARKAYHRVDDTVSRSLDVRIFDNDQIFEQVHFVDFYRYRDVGLEEVYAYLREKIPWVRPEDTGRSTNCLINDVGIYVHKAERGFHNYALPYSWDVRLGHKTREAALGELDDAIDEGFVEETLTRLGYTMKRGGRMHGDQRGDAGAEQMALVAFYVAAEGLAADGVVELSEEALRGQLGERLPPQLIPMGLHRVEAIPLTSSGKVDTRALEDEDLEHRPRVPYREAEGPVEEYLVDLWHEELGVERIGADDSFFALGGTSLTAMQVMLRLCEEFDIDLPLDTMFERPTLGGLARVAEDRILADAAEL